MNITVVKMVKAHVPAQPNLRGFVDVKIGEITVCDCRVIQQPGQKAYITGPQKQVGSAFYPVVKMSANLRDQVQAIVLNDALRAGIVTAAPPALPDNTQYQAQDLLSDGPSH